MYLLGLGVSLARALFLLLVSVTTFPQAHLLVSVGHSRKELSLWRQPLGLPLAAASGPASGGSTFFRSGPYEEDHARFRSSWPRDARERKQTS